MPDPDPDAGGALAAPASAAPAARRAPLWQRALPWLITVACFSYLYWRLEGAADDKGLSVPALLAGVFAEVDWWTWLAIMVPYSFVFFLIDTAVIWRVVNWFNTRVAYGDMLPIRGSSYILSIVNEQVGKGAMGLYLNRRYGVPGWEVGSAMLFVMFCEFFYLLGWATLGWGLQREALPAAFEVIPYLAVAAAVFFAAWIAFFRGGRAAGAAAEGGTAQAGTAAGDAGARGEAAIGQGADGGAEGDAEEVGFRDRPVFKAFREARPHQYLAVIALRSPAMISAVFVYTWTLRLFGVEVGYLEMLGYLPVVFFGAATPGPMRSVAITLWVELFPAYRAELALFGLVQHNFFIFFNAAIGLIFLRRAQRELVG